MTLFSLENEFFAGRAPGCYNDPDFRALEAKDPKGTLQSYARFVVTRDMSTAEAEHVRAAVPHVIGRLLDRASAAEIARNCYAASMACLQTLEANGIWGVVLTGSVRFRFPLSSGLGDQFFWCNDGARPGHKAGHAWLVIPPFQLIDVTAAFQGWRGREASFLPKAIVKESVTKRPFLMDLAAPPEHLKGYHVHPEHREFWKVFPPFEVDADRTQVCYQPYGVTVPAESLAEAVLTLGGRPVAQFVAEEIQPGLSALPQR